MSNLDFNIETLNYQKSSFFQLFISNKINLLFCLNILKDILEIILNFEFIINRLHKLKIKAFFLFLKNVLANLSFSIKKNVEVRGIDPLTFRMQSGRSTTELHPHVILKCSNDKAFRLWFFFWIWNKFSSWIVLKYMFSLLSYKIKR